jgi:hypothetical protein
VIVPAGFNSREDYVRRYPGRNRHFPTRSSLHFKVLIHLEPFRRQKPWRY